MTLALVLVAFIALISLGLNAAVVYRVYLATHKTPPAPPDQVGIKQVHKTCAVCGRLVARFKTQEDGSVVCENCTPGHPSVLRERPAP
jgi:DNA-directed RNA polymerase subunit RPC12/RpoP